MTRVFKDVGPTKRLVDADVLAKALGAEDTGIKLDTTRGPISLFALRQYLASVLHSTGGRPKLAGTESTRRKISYFEEDVEKLDKLAAYFGRRGLAVSSSQIASVLIHAELLKIDTSKIAQEKTKEKSKQKTSRAHQAR